jgi:hypothetical protein
MVNSPENTHPSPDDPLYAPETTHELPIQRIFANTFTMSHPQDLRDIIDPSPRYQRNPENDNLMRNLCIYTFILSAACIFIGMNGEAGCDFECLMRELVNMFTMIGGKGGKRKTRGGRNKSTRSISRINASLRTSRTPGNMRKTIRSKQGSSRTVLPSELLYLNVGGDSLIIIKQWISDNIGNIKDEKMIRLVNQLFERGEEILSKIKINKTSHKTMRQFIVEHKEQFLQAIRYMKQ